MCFCPQYTKWKTWNENVIKSYANKKCCSWLHKKETVISNTVLCLISILTNRISRDEIYLRKVSLPRVTGERISVVLQLLHPRAFLFLISVQRELFHGSWRHHCPGGAVHEFPSCPVQRVAWCLSTAEGTRQPAAFPAAMPGKGPGVSASGKWSVRVGSLWGARAPRPGRCPGAAGCGHQAAYAGAILGHPFLAPVLCPVDKERWRRAAPLLSPCVGPCGAVNQPFCCHLAQVCLLEGPENTWRGLGAPCASRAGLPAVAPLGLVSPGFPLRVGALSLAPWTRAPSAPAIARCCLPPSPHALLCSRHALLTCCRRKHLGGFAFCVKCLERPVWKVL